jgi:cytochrome c oxidase subunit 3
MPATLTEELVLQDVDGRGGEPGAGGDGWGGARGNPDTPRRAYFTLMALALAGILMFFMALTSAYLVRRGIGGDWRAIELPGVLWLNTGVLVASSLALERARRKFAAGALRSFRGWWLATTALGVVFLVGQYAAWRDLWVTGVFLATNPSSSFFYVFTTAHALHILGGLCALGYVAARSDEHLVRRGGIAADVAGVYWHFMDGLWVFLFLLLYLGR